MESAAVRSAQKGQGLTWTQRSALGIEKLGRVLTDWRKRQAFHSETARLDAAGQLGPILEDLGLTRSDVEKIARGYPQSERLCRSMAYHLNADIDALDPASVQTLRHTCALCTSHRACRRWLVRATATLPNFCPNLSLFDAARAGGGPECGEHGKA